MIDRRQLIVGGGLAALAACFGATACGSPSVPEPGTHPALRRPRPAGVVAFLGASSAAALRPMAAPDVMVGLAASLLPGADGPGPMPAFPGDVFLPERDRPDAVVQIEGDDPDACGRRLDELLAMAPDVSVRWRIAVTRDVAARSGHPLQRNPFGFVEGQTNPPAAAGVLRADGSSVLAVRVIRLAHELWSKDSPEQQARIIGRRPDGTWLDGSPADGEPRFADDPHGAAVPLDCHARTMNPRTPGTPVPRMLRRSWIYRGGSAAQSTSDDGVVFMAFQDEPNTGFALAQSRLATDALSPYLLAVGGGYFVVPPPDRFPG
jgi:deferrochelatase/peroxidase EfeB